MPASRWNNYYALKKTSDLTDLEVFVSKMLTKKILLTPQLDGMTYEKRSI